MRRSTAPGFPMRLFPGALVAAAVPLTSTTRGFRSSSERPHPLGTIQGGVGRVPLRLASALHRRLPALRARCAWSRAANTATRDRRLRSSRAASWPQRPRTAWRRWRRPRATAPARGNCCLGRDRGHLSRLAGRQWTATPRPRQRVYYPRFSYLERYLPGVYREEPASSSFLERFLANLEGELTPIEDRIAASQMWFDVRSAPADTLEWLASWLGLVLDPVWSDAKRRALIANAMTFYRYRGTIRGLQIALALSLFDCAPRELFTETDSRRSPARGIRVVEKFRTREAPRLRDRPRSRPAWPTAESLTPKHRRAVVNHATARPWRRTEPGANDEWPLEAPSTPFTRRPSSRAGEVLGFPGDRETRRRRVAGVSRGATTASLVQRSVAAMHRSRASMPPGRRSPATRATRLVPT